MLRHFQIRGVSVVFDLGFFYVACLIMFVYGYGIVSQIVTSWSAEAHVLACSFLCNNIVIIMIIIIEASSLLEINQLTK